MFTITPHSKDTPEQKQRCCRISPGSSESKTGAWLGMGCQKDIKAAGTGATSTQTGDWPTQGCRVTTSRRHRRKQPCAARTPGRRLGCCRLVQRSSARGTEAVFGVPRKPRKRGVGGVGGDRWRPLPRARAPQSAALRPGLAHPRRRRRETETRWREK